MRASFARETIVRLRYPLVEEYGVQRRDYAGVPDELPIERCYLEPLTSVENAGDGRGAVFSGYTVDAPSGVDVDPSDHVRYRGIEYAVAGDPLHLPSPTGALDSTRIILERWEG